MKEFIKAFVISMAAGVLVSQGNRFRMGRKILGTETTTMIAKV